VILAFAIIAAQPSTASAVPNPRNAASSALLIAGSPLSQASPAVASTCNGPAFSPPTGSNTTNAGSASFLPLAGGVATPNLWNVKRSAGTIKQCYNPDSGFTGSVNLSSLSLGPTHGPAGFPEIGYGESAYGSKFCGTKVPNCRIAPFPMPVSSFTKYQYLVKMTYSLGTMTPSQYWHLTFDLWLEQSVDNGPHASDVEVLISPWTSYPACGTAKPAFTTAGTTWRVYEGCGATSATTLGFNLKSPAQRKAGSLTLNLSSFVKEIRKLLPQDTSIAKEKMAGIEVGIEFNNYSCNNVCAPQQSASKFLWAISSLSFIQYSARGKTYHIIG
jgi:hypothetical protein